MNNTGTPPRQLPFHQVERIIRKILEFSVILFGTLIVLDVLAGVFTRYVLNAALSWTDEVGGYLLGWLGFLGAALLFGEGGHISFGLLVDSLPKRWRRSIIFGGYLLAIVFFFFVAYEGVFLITDLIGSRGISIPLPKPLIYSVMFISSILAICFLVFRSLAIWTEED